MAKVVKNRVRPGASGKRLEPKQFGFDHGIRNFPSKTKPRKVKHI